MLDDRPFHAMRLVLREHGIRWQRALPDLTKPQYAVLAALAEATELEQNLLVEAAASTKATLADLLARLEAQGVVERRTEPRDRRRRFVSLTDKGREIYAAARPRADAVSETFLRELEPDDRRELTRLLSLMVDSRGR
ncbi:MarR family winged helix-turn-helix transcriptional regulator [Nonomuraea jiangxiensis]|uniref:DNA-binding transcriptional regulator, MarR family n=1 Tax=Nonomuraea jiangxiensis TaxID=633440 RepID=A0A1G7ZDS0_9ACTN|nr:MarR family winged helix-turn-helix transcriptional regulator [Nonomuraea jiangxiensis]SDH06891.1 DNA-binding transcriptional regulator, MarR family [Nonomuraea jiangxiensis]